MPHELQRWLRTDGSVLIRRDQRRWRELLVRLGHVRRYRFNADRREHEAVAIRAFKIEHGVRHVVVVTAEIAHRPVAKIPPAIPARTREVRFVKRPRRRGAEPQVEMVRRGNRHFLRESIDDLHALVEPMRFVEFLRRGRILKSPCAIDPHVHFVHRSNHTGVEDFSDRATRL